MYPEQVVLVQNFLPKTEILASIACLLRRKNISSKQLRFTKMWRIVYHEKRLRGPTRSSSWTLTQLSILLWCEPNKNLLQRFSLFMLANWGRLLLLLWVKENNMTIHNGFQKTSTRHFRRWWCNFTSIAYTNILWSCLRKENDNRPALSALSLTKTVMWNLCFLRYTEPKIHFQHLSSNFCNLLKDNELLNYTNLEKIAYYLFAKNLMNAS